MNIKKKILLIILTITAIFSFAKIIIYYINSYQNKKTNLELIEKSIKKIDNKFKINYSKINNEDVVGWIIMNQNKINYPILKSNDNNFYLTRDYNKKNNQSGSIFMDFRNNDFKDKNTVIYGHSMLDGTMFGSLREMFKKGYFDIKNNNYIKIYDLNSKETTYQIFSYYIIDTEDYYITTSFTTEEQYKAFIDKIAKRSYKNFTIKIDTTDQILTLSTCSSNNKRKVIHAVKLSKE